MMLQFHTPHVIRAHRLNLLALSGPIRTTINNVTHSVRVNSARGHQHLLYAVKSLLIRSRRTTGLRSTVFMVIENYIMALLDALSL